MKHTIGVWGEFACFAMPALKVERFSYPVPTPSAARGIFDAIYCKPKEFRWQIVRIDCLGPPAYIALRRNEVKGTVSVANVQKWMAGKAEPEPLLADGDAEGEGRTQRQTMALKNVSYRLHAEIRPWPGFETQATAFDEQFARRVACGKCAWQPYLGCREFPAYFVPVESPPSGPPCPGLNLDLGFMLYDVYDLSRPYLFDPDRPKELNVAISLFRAHVCDGVLSVPDYDSPEVLKGARSDRL